MSLLSQGLAKGADAPAGYDIIGDVHGCADSLVRLLELLGYRKRNGVYCHKDRQVVFVGDIVDRGPGIREALHIVRDMVEAGSAQMVMGNHEYNAIIYTTKARPALGREYLRDHDRRGGRLIAETLDQFANHPADWRDFLGWFQTLPLFLEFEQFRVVHACWDQPLIDRFRAEHDSQINLDFIHNSVEPGSFAGQLVNRLTRGTDMPLPGDHVITSRDGFKRRFFRTRFWGREPKTYGDIVFQPDPLPEAVHEQAISAQDRQRLSHYSLDQRPLFIGHYWLQGQPQPVASNLACLDYSAVNWGKMVAYRMDGEQQLSADKFVWVDLDPEHAGL